MSKTLIISAILLSIFFLAISIGFAFRTYNDTDVVSEACILSKELNCDRDEEGDMICCLEEESYMELKKEVDCDKSDLPSHFIHSYSK